jgi:hypothetical protein
MIQSRIQYIIDSLLEQDNKPLDFSDIDFGDDWDTTPIDILIFPAPGEEDNAEVIEQENRERASKLRSTWNEQYPEYPIFVTSQRGPQGVSFAVRIHAGEFQRAVEDSATFPDGPKQAVFELADSLGLVD